MSDTAQTIDSWDVLLLRVADQIAPLFEASDIDPAPASKDFARKAAISALAAYYPESRADFVNIARILAFSMASLVALGLAAAADLTPAQKMRCFGRANALNRSADQAERMMLRRRRDQRVNPPAEVPASVTQQPIVSPQDDLALDAAIAEAIAEYRATKPPQAAAPPAGPNPEAPPMVDPQSSWDATVLRAAVPTHRSRISYRQTLLHGSTMPPAATGTGPQPPA
jgi:hypothetical protein